MWSSKLERRRPGRLQEEGRLLAGAVWPLHWRELLVLPDWQVRRGRWVDIVHFVSGRSVRVLDRPIIVIMHGSLLDWILLPSRVNDKHRCFMSGGHSWCSDGSGLGGLCRSLC